MKKNRKNLLSRIKVKRLESILKEESEKIWGAVEKNNFQPIMVDLKIIKRFFYHYEERLERSNKKKYLALKKLFLETMAYAEEKHEKIYNRPIEINR